MESNSESEFDLKDSFESLQSCENIGCNEEVSALVEAMEAVPHVSTFSDSKPAQTGSEILKETLTVPYILNGELYQILSRNGENVTVRCCSCPAGRFYRGSVRSTGNFHMHIKRRHPYLLAKLHDMKVSSLLERRDRLMKNRKAKLRHMLVDHNGRRGDQEQHKLKIKRAFQRHQAEAKGNDKGVKQGAIPMLQSNEGQYQIISKEVHADRNRTNQILDQMQESLVAMSSGNACCELRVLDVLQLSPIKTDVSTQQTTRFLGTNESIASNEYSPSTSSDHKSGSYSVENPLDLSRGERSNSLSTTNSYSSTNTVSPSMFIDQIDSQVSTQSDIGGNAFRSENVGMILRDIRNDLRTRNRIEHNRLMLEIAKMKYLHPGFFFNFQD